MGDSEKEWARLNHLSVILPLKYGSIISEGREPSTEASDAEGVLGHHDILHSCPFTVLPEPPNTRPGSPPTEPNQPRQRASNRVNHRGVGSFFIHPRLGLESFTKLTVHRHPDILRLPFEEKEHWGKGRIEVRARVVNRGMFTWFFLPTVRAKDARARLLLFDTKSKDVYHVKCFWTSELSETMDIPASFTPELLTLFQIHPYTHQVILLGDKGIEPIPTGRYAFTLILDAEATSATEVDMDEYDFPNSFLDDKNAFDVWKGTLKEDGYAVFFERTSDNRTVARTVGKIPPADLARIKSKLKFAFTWEEV